MDLAYLAGRLEDGINKRNVVRHRAQGWRPRVIGYTGYGSTTSLHILGRVVMADPEFTAEEPTAPGDAMDSRFVEDDETPTLQQSPAQIALEAQRGWRTFFTTPVAHLPISVSAGETSTMSTTDKGGYIDVLLRDHGLAPGWHDVVIEAKAAQPVVARVLVISDEATIGLVSDIDDTVMVTWLPRALIAAWNTFVKHSNTRQPVPGMAKLYRRLREANPEMPVFYLSTGAWNVVPTLRAFLARHGFPFGPLLMTDWGPTQTGLFRSGQEHKRVQLRNLAITFPHLTWVLVGDDGQHDPMIYDDFAREHPTHVAAIAIRELTPTEQVLSHGTTEALVEPGRLRNAQQEHGVPEVRGRDGFEIAEDLPELVSRRLVEMTEAKDHENKVARRATGRDDA